MPIWRNMPSMPKVRASSGTMGTMCLPMFLSLTRMVENAHQRHGGGDLALAACPRAAPLKASSGGTVSGGAAELRAGR